MKRLYVSDTIVPGLGKLKCAAFRKTEFREDEKMNKAGSISIGTLVALTVAVVAAIAASKRLIAILEIDVQMGLFRVIVNLWINDFHAVDALVGAAYICKAMKEMSAAIHALEVGYVLLLQPEGV